MFLLLSIVISGDDSNIVIFLSTCNVSPVSDAVIASCKVKYSSFVDNIFTAGNWDKYLLSTPLSIFDIIS